jgi:hypothetical protein
VSPMKYGLGFYIPEDDILYSPRLENFKSYTVSGLMRLIFFRKISKEENIFFKRLYHSSTDMNK